MDVQDIAPNTAYYRRNKQQKNILWSCRECNFETTGPKICLTNHIYSKHTAEHEKPFQCEICKKEGTVKGFAQKAFLGSHLHRVHNIKTKKPGKELLHYNITRGNILPRHKKTEKRIDWYISMKKITKQDLKKEGYKISQVQYDARSNYIITETILKQTSR